MKTYQSPRQRYRALLARLRKSDGNAVSMPDGDTIVLGLDGNNKPITVPANIFFEHTHIIAGPGGGKSRLLRHLIRVLRMRGWTIILIDPHGGDPQSPFAQTLADMIGEGLSPHVLEFAHPAITGFDPLTPPIEGIEPAVMAYSVVHTIEMARGGQEDTRDTPTTRRALIALLAALSQLGLSLADLGDLLEPDDPENLRAYVKAQLTDPEILRTFNRLQRLANDPRRSKDFDIETIGTLNRISEITNTPKLRHALQLPKRLPIAEIMATPGEVFLANLQPSRSVDVTAADMYGRMFVHNILLAAKFRQTNNPVIILIDECPRVLSPDIGIMLPEVRKMKVGVVLAHQFEQQLIEFGGPLVAEAVKNATELRIVGRIKGEEEAERLAPEVMRLDLEQPVQASIRPTVVGQRIRKMKSESATEHTARSTGESTSTSLTHSRTSGTSSAKSTGRVVNRGTAISRTHGTAHGTGHAIGHVESAALSSGASESAGMTAEPFSTMFGAPLPNALSFNAGSNAATSAGSSDASSHSSSALTNFNQGSTESSGHAVIDMQNDGTNESESVAVGRSKGTSSADMHGLSRAEGLTEGLEPIYQDLPASFHSRDHATYLAAQQLRSLVPGRFLMRFRNTISELRVPNIEPHPLTYEALYDLVEIALQRSPSTTQAPDIDGLIKERRQKLLTSAAACSLTPARDDPESFFIDIPYPDPPPRKEAGSAAEHNASVLPFPRPVKSPTE